MLLKTVLLVIDAQHDFCDPSGALFVPGADADVRRISDLIRRRQFRLNQIVVTLDTHHVLDISHPGFWSDSEGNAPAPFTSISLEDVVSNRWIPRAPQGDVADYLRRLENQGEFAHLIWPEHCLAGSPGAALVPELAEAIRKWAHLSGTNYQVVVKGTHPLTEHFGIFEAQVPLARVPETQLNQTLISSLENFDEILVCGEARSHCVATSIRQLMRYAPHLADRTKLLTDCTSDVSGLGYLADPIYAEARDRGMQFIGSTEV